jgi:cell division protein FtsN
MEQRKLLIIIISVSVFIALVVGVGLLWFYPKPKPAQAAATSGTVGKTEFDPIEWVRTKEGTPPLTQTDKPAGDAKDDVIIVYGDKSGQREKAPAAEPAKAQPEKAPLAAPVPVVKKAEPAAQPVQKAPAPRPALKTVTVTEYTIQVGSFSSRDKADEAVKTLKDKGLTPAVTTKSIADKQYYRLRIGPYDTKGEAEKFLEWVKAIPGFQESIVFEGTVKKQVPK